MKTDTIYELGYLTEDGFFGFYGPEFSTIEEAKKYAASVSADVRLTGVYATCDLGTAEIERF